MFSAITNRHHAKFGFRRRYKFDARAVAIYFGEHKLGFVPRSENRIFYKLLKVGITSFEARIQMIDGKKHPENQVQVVVHLIGE